MLFTCGAGITSKTLYLLYHLDLSLRDFSFSEIKEISKFFIQMELFYHIGGFRTYGVTGHVLSSSLSCTIRIALSG